MIYITGDCHGDFRRFSTRIFPEQKEMTKEDYVIICGDFGSVWNRDGESKEETAALNLLEERSFTTLFIDGNHENFDRLYAYPAERWHGGKVHKIRDSVLHLMRGQIFELEGKTFFTFGGASSHDIDGGILELDDPLFKRKRSHLNKDWIPYRINHVSWWKQELPDAEEMEEGLSNLERYHYDVDFIVTHCCASSTQAVFSCGTFKTDVLTDYLEQIHSKCRYKKWFFGHYHDNKNITAQELMIYEQIIRIS